MPKFIDIHTHSTHQQNDETFIIKNIILPDQHVVSNQFCTVGWHPWFIGQYSLTEIEKRIEQETILPKIIAIGECGIDRAIEVPIEIQRKVFEIHLHQAKKLKKPLIIHAVRAYSDILEILKKHQFELPVIFHDYYGNEQQTNQLLKFNSYFSFGQSILKPSFKIEKLKSIPLNNLFFETDESKISIQKIYLRAAELLDIPVIELKDRIVNNFKEVFGNGLVE